MTAGAPLTNAQLLERALRLADAAVVSDVEVFCPWVELACTRWYDTRPMLDPREHSPEIVDMATQAIDYALQRGLAMRHPDQPHLLHITRHR